ncbi:MAG: hypothetical protein V5A44_03205 [Haloarculaceae archaeon]
MRARRGPGVGVVVATGLLLVATVGLASLPPRPLRSALAVLHALTFRVATEWLAVVALLAVGGRSVRRDASVDRATVAALATGVFVGGVAIEASPLARLVVAPSPVDATLLVEGVVDAVRRALYPTGLLLAVAVGAATVRDASGPAHRARSLYPLPLAPSDGWVPTLPARAVGRALAVLGVVSVASFAVGLVTRAVLGAPYPWLAVADAGVTAVGAGVGYAVLAGAFLVLAVEGVTLRSLGATAAALWLALALAGVAGGVATAGLGVALVGVAGTPMPAVEAAGFGRWPAPHSWATLLRLGTLLAGGIGLLALQRTAETPRPTGHDAPAESPAETDAVNGVGGDPQGSGGGPSAGTGTGTGGRAGAGSTDPAGTTAGERR